MSLHNCFQRNWKSLCWNKHYADKSFSVPTAALRQSIIMASESIFVSSSLTRVKEIRLKLLPRPSHDSWNWQKHCQEMVNSMVLVGSSAHSYFSKNQKLVTIWEEVPNQSWRPRHSVGLMTSKAWCCSGQSLLPKSIRVHVLLSAAYHHRLCQINKTLSI